MGRETCWEAGLSCVLCLPRTRKERRWGELMPAGESAGTLVGRGAAMYGCWLFAEDAVWSARKVADGLFALDCYNFWRHGIFAVGVGGAVEAVLL